ncbi:hypothetical protein L7F22_049640 [Adiantum nelumboides]|nr:hypothetical protein [Adiantum nelumboides]
MSNSPSASSATVFVEFQSMNNIIFLTGWSLSSTTFNSTNIGYAINLDACKQACLRNCSCYGITYQRSTSSCFLISHNISFLSVTDYQGTLWKYTTTPGDNPTVFNKKIHAEDYVTYFKIAAFSSDKSSNDVPFSLMTLIGIIPSSLLACLFLGLGASHLRKRRRRFLQQAREDEELRDILPLLPARFSYKELRIATKGFCELLGAGACGSVYAGTLSDGRRVAVKVLEGVLQGVLQSRDFLAEVATVGRTGHHNIVRLVGFCWQVSHRILVYEYVERGSLDRWLFGGERDTLLDWQKRYNIALGVARAYTTCMRIASKPSCTLTSSLRTSCWIENLWLRFLILGCQS